MSQSKRKNALEGTPLPWESGEPAGDLGMTPAGADTPDVLGRRPSGRGRKTPVRPSEKKRRRRRMSVTFSGPGVPARIRELALRWGMFAPDGQSPNVSAVVEYLLIPQLEAAERGEFDPPAE